MIGNDNEHDQITGRAQQTDRMRRIVVLSGIAHDQEAEARIASFLQGLAALGWKEGPGHGADAHEVIYDGVDPGNAFCGHTDRAAMPLISSCSVLIEPRTMQESNPT